MVELSCHNINSLKILLLYKKNDKPVTEFFEILRYLIISMNIDIVIGDFNLKPTEIPNNILDVYKQLVIEPTHLRGATLDQAYIRKTLLEEYMVEVNVKCIFFSDHEAVRICLKRN